MAMLKRLVLAVLHRLGVYHALREGWRADLKPTTRATHEVERAVKGLRQEINGLRLEHGSKAERTEQRRALELSIREVDGAVRRLGNELKPELGDQRDLLR